MLHSIGPEPPLQRGLQHKLQIQKRLTSFGSSEKHSKTETLSMSCLTSPATSSLPFREPRWQTTLQTLQRSPASHGQKAACPSASALDQLQGDLHHTGLLQPAHQLSLGLLSLHQPRLQRDLQLLVQDAEHGDGRHLPSSQAEGSMLHSLGSGACSRKAFVTRPANT